MEDQQGQQKFSWAKHFGFQAPAVVAVFVVVFFIVMDRPPLKMLEHESPLWFDADKRPCSLLFGDWQI